MGKHKKFAKGAEVRHFKLVSRSGEDPNRNDPDATPLVLEAFVPKGEQKRTGKTTEELMQIPESLHVCGPEVFGLGERDSDEEAEEEAARQKAAGARRKGSDEEEDEDELAHLEGDCYFPNDGYNYEKHLKTVSDKRKGGGLAGVILEAPKSADVPSKPKLMAVPETGMMAPVVIGKLAAEVDVQAARTQEEQELMRALEMEDEYEELDENDLEDLIPAGLAEDSGVVVWGPTALEQRDLPDMDAFKAQHKAMLAANAANRAANADGGSEAEGRERGASADDEIDDEDFEAFLADEYGKADVGACEEEEIEGHVELDEEVLDDYLKGCAKEAEMLSSVNEPIKGKYDAVPRVIEETRALIERYYTDGVALDEDGDDETTNCDDQETVDESRDEDCETVLSTLSNISNRPGKIGRIKIAVPKKKAMDKVDEDDENDSSDESVIELPDVITERKKDETPEEKKARKASVKEMRRVCRKMKKESKDMYKTEAAKMPGKRQTGDVRSGLRTTPL